eukprot:9430790-Alexandrium_andersonii.AAC.1
MQRGNRAYSLASAVRAPAKCCSCRARYAGGGQSDRRKHRREGVSEAILSESDRERDTDSDRDRGR